jgi:hypothetical protein
MMSGSLEAMAALLERQHSIIEARMEKQQDKMEQKVEQLQQTLKVQAAEAKAEMDAQRLDNEKLRAEVAEASIRAEMQAKVDGAAAARLRDQQLVALQGRLEALSAAKLLTDDELFAVEDVIADSTGSGEASGDDQVTMLLALSARMAMDSAFARQLRRKVVAQ